MTHDEYRIVFRITPYMWSHPQSPHRVLRILRIYFVSVCALHLAAIDYSLENHSPPGPIIAGRVEVSVRVQPVGRHF